MVIPLANSAANLRSGLGVHVCIADIKLTIEHFIFKCNPNVFMLTEFGRRMTPESYTSFIEWMASKGFSRSLGWKRNVDEQKSGPNPDSNPMSMETIVFTSLTEEEATLHRFPLVKTLAKDCGKPYDLSNGAILLKMVESKETVAYVHSTLSHGSGPLWEIFVEELRMLRAIPNSIVAGDLNLVDGVTSKLFKEDRKLLDYFLPFPSQPDFICGTTDFIPLDRLVPIIPESFPIGYDRTIIETKDNEYARVISTLSLVSRGWDKCFFFHPQTNRDMTGCTLDDVAKETNLQAKDVFDHFFVLSIK